MLLLDFAANKGEQKLFLSLPGRKFDKNGELIEKRTRWSEPAIKMFQEKAKCLVEQFSHYKVLNKFHVSKKQDYYSLFLVSPLWWTRQYSSVYGSNIAIQKITLHCHVTHMTRQPLT